MRFFIQFHLTLSNNITTGDVVPDFSFTANEEITSIIDLLPVLWHLLLLCLTFMDLFPERMTDFDISGWLDP
ncbi:hypothetical protein F8M41_003064 [Gigaspora margarita]|uniref:Uncharacterized protein n=1 Tax=Gigaspora margarita TaxID=4874 RepID=A0A8H3XEU8_GIGMA|nr:hypothetical protein F8M41_003064 [Gigaspora margarita]